MKKIIQLAFLLLLPCLAFGQATVNWTNQHQVIDGFGGSDESHGSSMPTSGCGPTGNCQTFFFGTGSGQLGYSILRVGLTNGNQDGGSCLSVGSSCAGGYVGDMEAAIANGARIYASPWSPPAAYTTNGSTVCTAGSGSGQLATGHYADFATWETNFVKSLAAQSPSIPLFAVSVQNEPNFCPSYDGAEYSAAQLDTYIKTNLGPTFSGSSIGTLIITPEGDSYSSTSGLGGTCVGDSSCAQYLAGYQFHAYDQSVSGSYVANSQPSPSGWPAKKWWQTEVSCGPGYGPSGACPGGFNTSMSSALPWAALIDQAMQDGANAWLFWQLIDYNGAATSVDNSMMANSAGGYAVPSRAYVLGQYAKFVRPGYYRIDATHIPQANVTVSAYQNTSSNTLDIIATNYSSSPITQTFNITNAPTFTTVTPTVTSPSQNLQTLSSVSITGNSFSYALPAQSVTTFAATASSGGGPSPVGLLNTNRYPFNNSWTSAGAGTIPARTTICQTLGMAGQSPTYSQSVTAANIVTALQACAGSNQTVYLNPGTYTMTQTLGQGINFPSNVTLRGAGANQTILTWTATTGNCNGIGATAFCIYNGDSGAIPYVANAINWTGGYSQGTTTLTLGSAVTGSLSNLHVGTLLDLNQLDSTSDNGNWWRCGTSGTNGDCSQQGVANAWGGRTQNQIVTVTAISGSTVTFTPGLYAPNWSTSNTPYATFSSTLPVTGFGLENLQINTQQLGDIQAMTEMLWVTNSWVKNVALINNVVSYGAARKHVELSSDAHITVRDSYMYGSQPGSEAYGVDMLWGTADSLAENNICQHIASCIMNETSEGNVFGYNFAVDNFYTGFGSAPNWQQADLYMNHDAGTYYNLFEGHEGISAGADNIHGTSFGETLFRSYLSGLDQATTCPPGSATPCTGAKNQNTQALGMEAFNRYYNLVGNVFGTPSYFNSYQYLGLSGNPTSCPSYGFTGIYSLNFSAGTNTVFSPTCFGTSWTMDNDSLTSGSLMRWGNYDTVNGSVQTNLSETASGAPTYPGLTNPSTSWSTYPSFYLTGKPTWWVFPSGTTAPWPAIGPDITGGNIPGISGHAYHNPAANCFLNVLGGKTDGSSGPLSFDARNCYANSTPTAPTPTFSPVPGTYGTTQSVTITDAGFTICYTTDGSAPTAPVAGTCSGGTTQTYTGSPISVSTTTTIQAIGTLASYLNSATGGGTWTISSVTLPAPTFSPNTPPNYYLPSSFPLSVTPTIQAGSAGCYTLDGTTPTATTPGSCSHGTTYASGTISVTANETLNMLSTQSGHTNSPITAATYLQRNAILESTCSFNGGNSSVTTGTCTLSPNPTAGDGMSCGYAIGNNTATGTFSDNVGGVYLVANASYYGASTFAASGRVYRTGLPGGTTIVTFNLSIGSSYTGFGCEAYKPSSAGIFTLDTAFTQTTPYPLATTGNSASPAVASITPTNANEIVYGQVLNATYTTSPTAGSGFTLVNPLPGSPLLYPEYQIQTTATATTLPFTLSASDFWQEQPTAFYFSSSSPAIPTNATPVSAIGVLFR